MKRRGAERDQRLAPSFRESILLRPRDPLGQHGKRSPSLLVLGERLPLPLEYRQRRWMEGVAHEESLLEERPSLGLSGGRVNGGPFGRQLSASLEAPLRKRLCHPPPNP